MVKLDFVVKPRLVHKSKKNMVYEYNRPGMFFKVYCSKTSVYKFKWLVKIMCRLTSPYLYNPVQCMYIEKFTECRVGEFYATSDEEVVEKSKQVITHFIKDYYS